MFPIMPLWTGVKMSKCGQVPERKKGGGCDDFSNFFFLVTYPSNPFKISSITKIEKHNWNQTYRRGLVIAAALLHHPPLQFRERENERDVDVAGGEHVPSVELHLRNEGAQDGEGHFRCRPPRSHESQVFSLSLNFCVLSKASLFVCSENWLPTKHNARKESMYYSIMTNSFVWFSGAEVFIFLRKIIVFTFFPLFSCVFWAIKWRRLKIKFSFFWRCVFFAGYRKTLSACYGISF